jgi:hypothetical protein
MCFTLLLSATSGDRESIADHETTRNKPHALQHISKFKNLKKCLCGPPDAQSRKDFDTVTRRRRAAFSLTMTPLCDLELIGELGTISSERQMRWSRQMPNVTAVRNTCLRALARHVHTYGGTLSDLHLKSFNEALAA